MFGRKEMYKKGLADAMQAYEAFGKKQEAALEQMRKEVQQGNKKLEEAINEAVASFGGSIQGLYGYLNSKEKAALYQLSTPMDIKEIPEQEKRYLLAVLYQLSDDEGDGVTEDQRAYVRSVKRYLEITNPQTDADLTAVENIDSLDVQKAFLQVVLEFLYLQSSDMLSDSQEEFLSYFSLNKKQAELIEVRVSRLFNAMGAQGLAEKYGYVPEEKPTQEAAGGDKQAVPAESNSDLDTAELDDIEEAIADKIYDELRWLYFIETKDYIVYSRIFGGIHAISKKSGESKCLLSSEHYPHKCFRGIAKCTSSENRLYAFFSEKIFGSADVYMIGAVDGKILPAKFSVDPAYCCAANDRYFVHSDSNGKLSCVDLLQKKKYPIVHQDSGSNDRICTEKALYFTDQKSSPPRLMEYTFDSRVERPLAELPPNCGTAVMSYYDNKIFVMSAPSFTSSRCCSCNIGYFDFLSRQYHAVKKENISLESDLDIIKCRGGWLFCDNGENFHIKYFDFKTMDILTIADKCTRRFVFFSSDASFMRIGKWVYFEQGDNHIKVKVRIDRPMQVEVLGEAL